MAEDIIFIQGTVVQAVKDKVQSVAIKTGLGITDQKTVWELVAMDVEFTTAVMYTGLQAVLAHGILSRKADIQDRFDSNTIGGVSWCFTNGAATVGSAVPLDYVQRVEFIDEPLVANSEIYFNCYTAGTNFANRMGYRIFYRVKKVSEIEFLKAQSPYCVC